MLSRGLYDARIQVPSGNYTQVSPKGSPNFSVRNHESQVERLRVADPRQMQTLRDWKHRDFEIKEERRIPRTTAVFLRNPFCVMTVSDPARRLRRVSSQLASECFYGIAPSYIAILCKQLYEFSITHCSHVFSEDWELSGEHATSKQTGSPKPNIPAPHPKP